MEFKEQAGLLKKVLGLKKEPLAITFTNDEVSEGLYEKTSICKALKRAAEGDCFIIDEKVESAPAVAGSAVSRSLSQKHRGDDCNGSLLKERSSPVRLYPLKEC